MHVKKWMANGNMTPCFYAYINVSCGRLLDTEDVFLRERWEQNISADFNQLICWFQEANSGEKKRPRNFYCNKRVVFQRCMNWNKQTNNQKCHSNQVKKYVVCGIFFEFARMWTLFRTLNRESYRREWSAALRMRFLCSCPGWGVRRKHFSWAVQTFFFFYSYSSYSSRHLWWEALSRSRQCVPVAPITMHG